MDGRRRVTSVKPGRGPSFMVGIASLISVLFGIVWTAVASRIASFASPSPLGSVAQVFPLFGILFIVFGIANAVYNFRNATARNRHSIIELTTNEDEPDPLNRRFGAGPHEGEAWHEEEALRNARPPGEDEAETSREGQGDVDFCPYCGEPVRSDFRFCPECGKRLPERGG